MRFVQALYRKETANSVKLAVSHIGLCPSHEDFERIALKILRRQHYQQQIYILSQGVHAGSNAKQAGDRTNKARNEEDEGVMKMSFRGNLESKTKDALYRS
ncbi:TPA: hypothetical protein ACH3X2_001314 [Trebouxia sp. C0005]